MTREEAIEIVKTQYPHDHVMKMALGLLIPELREKPLTSFQQCLNLILHKVYYASVPGKIKDVDKFILDIVKNRTDELVELAKRQEKINCQLRESEDERIRKAIVSLVYEMKGTYQSFAKVELDKMVAWLEKQKERKPAWSEEDSKRYISIGTTLGTSAVLPKEDYDANMAWLRELVNAKKYSSPKPSWKPSEEQMEALNAMNCCGELSYQGQQQLLIDLYQQLKKL